jgi:hypothetical protein
MMALVDRALALNLSRARGWSIGGNLRLWAASWTLRLSPPRSHCVSILGEGPAVRTSQGYAALDLIAARIPTWHRSVEPSESVCALDHMHIHSGTTLDILHIEGRAADHSGKHRV